MATEVVAAPRPLRVSRAVVWSVACAAIIVASYFAPWWTFRLDAPQYPEGLRLVVYLHGIGGDVDEVDLINHYIGMAPLAAAAPVERAWSVWLVGGVAAAIVGTRGLGWRWGPLVFAGALPVIFVADLAYWLAKYGRNLDPRAALDIPPFTPTLLGPGQVGQFGTMAWPQLGFFLSLVAVLAAAMATREDR